MKGLNEEMNESSVQLSTGWLVAMKWMTGAVTGCLMCQLCPIHGMRTGDTARGTGDGPPALGGQSPYWDLLQSPQKLMYMCHF